MKDEGLIPTGTFKARGAAVGVSRAAELGVKGIAMPTNGNAGAAWATGAVPCRSLMRRSQSVAAVGCSHNSRFIAGSCATGPLYIVRNTLSVSRER